MPQISEYLRQAAVLVASLDGPLAEQLLERLAPEDAARVRAAAHTVGRISPTEREMAMQAFVEAGPIPPRESTDAAGIELDESLASRLAGLVDENREATSASGPFGFLEDADAESIAVSLQCEHPQTIAVVLSCLASDRAAELLVRFPSKLQVNILRRLSDLEPGDPESVQAIASELRTWVEYQRQRKQRRDKGLSTIQGILAAVDQDDRAILVGEIQDRDAVLASRISAVETAASRNHERKTFAEPESEHKASTNASSTPAAPSSRGAPSSKNGLPATPSLRFDDVVHLNDRDWTTLFRSAEPELTVLALTGASEPMIDRIASRLTPRDAATLRRSLAFPGPTKLSDVEAARVELARLAGQIAHAQPPAA